MACFEGEWKLESTSSNFSDFLKHIGVGMIKRNIALKLKPTITFTMEANGFTFKNVSIKTTTVKYTYGVAVDDESPDGEKGKQVWKLEGDRMTGTFNSVTGNVFEIERWVADGKLHQTLTCKGMTVTRVFKRS